MFMEAQELMGSIDKTADYSENAVADVMKSKLIRADARKLTDSIARDGVREPVQLIHERRIEGTVKWMGHGHHRVAAANDISKVTGQPKYVPVVHSELNKEYGRDAGMADALYEMKEHYPKSVRSSDWK
jgi:uncharacterized ParB-like nuclease family protein